MENLTRPSVSAAANVLRSLLLHNDKKHLFLTGSRGIGKSTLLSAALGKPAHGLISHAVLPVPGSPPSHVMLTRADTGASACIGRYQDRMTAVPDGFSLGLQAIRDFLQSDGTDFVIDEIGFLEGSVPEYQAALWTLLDQKRVTAVLRKQDTPFLNRLRAREDALVIDLDDWYARYAAQKVGCVIMASGFSRRFSSNKLLADYHGTPLIASLFSALPQSDFADAVLVTRYPEAAALAENHGIRTVLHDLPYLGDTIRLGISAFSDLDGYMLCVADQPLLTAETFRTLLAALALQPDRIIRPVHDGTPGNPVLFPGWCREELCAIQGDNGGRVVIRAHMDRVTVQEIADAKEFFDVDTIENLETLKNTL
ncbi:MAG: NTP transferase domain-containing protein [Clostridia bacterium]|nr:NTP transferase domain-containing protein [Clostridia bacterium]